MKFLCCRFVMLLLAAGYFFNASAANALIVAGPGPEWWNQNYKWCPDPPDDAVGGNSYEVLGIGYAIVDNFLVVCVDTNFPITGLNGRDSYNSNTHFSPGDLYINVGGMFQNGDGTVWGVSTTPRGGDVTENVPDGPWSGIMNPGNLYYNANFATGTFEGYPTGTPSDGNDGDGVNDYPTLVMNWQQGFNAALGQSAFYYDAANTDYYYYVDLNLIDIVMNGGLLDTNGNLSTTVQLTWAMECGNDLAEYKIEIPEPTTVALVSAGVAALAARRRRSIL